jgi:hypothetical protein
MTDNIAHENLNVEIYFKPTILTIGDRIKFPQYSVHFNNNLAVLTFAEPKDGIHMASFSIVTIVNGDNVIDVRLLNKGPRDTQLDADGNIVGDLSLEIVKVMIDDIDLGDSLIKQHCIYDLDQEVSFNGVTTKQLKEHVNLSWNGSWKLTFKSPFYLWLLESL